jgi:23S rRNA pseudouridine1911/1915/1917 synthase
MAPAPLLTILYEDNHCLAIAKPAGLSTQAPPGVASLEALARTYLKERYHKPGNVYLGIPHRLDRPVSGVVLFARQTVSAQRLAEQFRSRQVRKIYWAVVDLPATGEAPPEEGTWEDFLVKVPQEARAERVEPGTPGARQAVLHFRRERLGESEALLRIELETGRMHQVRVQAASRNWPIRGDELYGSRRPFGPVPASAGERAIALHARTLVFLHPIRYEPIAVTAPLPPFWQTDLPAGFAEGWPDGVE